MADFTRRRALLASTSVLTAGIAGCNGIVGRDTASEGEETEASSAGEKAELEQRIDELEAENERLRSQANDTPDDTSEVEQELAAEKERAEELREELEETTSSVEDLEAELTLREERIEELERKVGSYYSQATIHAAREVMNKAKDAVVHFTTNYGGGVTSGGTGWFVDEHTVITNGHVIEEYYNGNAEDMTIHTTEGNELSFTIEGAKNTFENNAHVDIGVISIRESALATLDIGSTSTVDIGDPLVQVGHPSMIGNWIGALGERIETHTSNLTMEIPSKSGNSGSPVMNLDGDVVGCTHSSGPRITLSSGDGVPRSDMTELYMRYPYRETHQAHALKTDTIKKYYEDWG